MRRPKRSKLITRLHAILRLEDWRRRDKPCWHRAQRAVVSGLSLLPIESLL
jgi:hypothetical protein